LRGMRTDPNQVPQHTMKRHPDISALVLAAGYSSRMKRFKPLLQLGQTTVLERCVRLFNDAGVQDIRVVIGHRADELKPLLDRLGVRWVVNRDFDEGMFSSVRAGVEDLKPSCHAFFLLPVDIPLVRRTTVLDLLAARETHKADIFYPTFLGRRGHPPLIAATCRSALLSWEGDGGLRAFLDQHTPEDRNADVPVADEHVLLDMDTPQDYGDFAERLSDYDVPSVPECLTVLRDKFAVSQSIVAHSTTVARVALALARALNAAGNRLNLKLIAAAALLHDVAKGQPDHAAVAERLVKEMGYPAVARVVGAHTDVQVVPDAPISPQEIVCLADKMVQADSVVSVETRFGNSLQAYSGDPGAVDMVIRRKANILVVKGRVERALGSPVETVLQMSLSRNEGLDEESLSLQTRSDRA
jgi:molybdenum cofactor cytidylyltransferase